MSANRPFTTVGILGAGQLGRMLSLAAYPLGLLTRSYDTSADAPAAPVSAIQVGSFDDAKALASFAAQCDLITYEFENVALEAAQACAAIRPIAPSLDALRISQDRALEKQCFKDLGIPTADFKVLPNAQDSGDVLAQLGLPVVIKTTRFGYDGKGQAVARTPAEYTAALEGFKGKAVIVEKFIPFDRELSIICVVGDKETVFYPLVQNTHRNGILRLSQAPAPALTDTLQAQAESYMRKLVPTLKYRGVLVLELFERQGTLIANEMAPRVHNSGHWSIEGAVTSQFENHLRAIVGLPLGSTALRARSAMVNIIGNAPDTARVLAFPGTHLHLYGKSPRAGRKIGHITICERDRGTSDGATFEEQVQAVVQLCADASDTPNAE